VAAVGLSKKEYPIKVGLPKKRIAQKGILQRRSLWSFGRHSSPRGILLVEPTGAKKKIIGGRYCNCDCFTQDFLDNRRDKTAGKQPRLHGITSNHSSGYNPIYVSQPLPKAL